MRRVMNSALLAAALLGLAAAATPPAALAAPQDGSWSVLIVTETGDCDRGYRYNVNVSNGRVSHRGDSSVDLDGTVAPNGAVKVSIRFGERGANGTGRLTANSGGGTWRGRGSTGTCAGRWEAERR